MPQAPHALPLTIMPVVLNAQVPPPSRGSLYLRPLLLGTGPLLGLCPAPSYTFVLYAVPVGGRAKVGKGYLLRGSLLGICVVAKPATQLRTIPLEYCTLASRCWHECLIRRGGPTTLVTPWRS